MKWMVPDQEVDQRGPRERWKEMVQKDCQAYKFE